MNNAVRWLAPDLLAVPEPAPVEESFELTEPDPEHEPEPLLQLPTLEEIQQIQDAAEKDGFDRGHADGQAQGQAEVRRLVAQIEGILDNFSRPLVRLENEAVAALGELAVRIAGTLVGRAYQTDPELLAQLVNEAVDAVGGASRDVEVRLHPECQLITCDRSIHLLQVWRRSECFRVEFLDEVELLALRVGFQQRACDVVRLAGCNRLVSLTDRCSLINRG